MDELVKVALVGTARHAGLPLDPQHPADALFVGATFGSPEHQLLLRAGVHAVYRQAGYRPLEALPAHVPAPADIAATCSPKLVELLKNLLTAESKELFPEFLGHLQECGLLLPPEVLPHALYVTDPELRRQLLPVMGNRGRWLSQFNPEWAWVVTGIGGLSSSDITELRRAWDEGDIALRCDVLNRLRQSQPAEARQWLTEVWNQEKADYRNRLLQQLETVSNEDEAFLEDALGDRSEYVRAAAAALLARLPESRLAHRMRSRAEQMLRGERSGLLKKKLKLVCYPPEEIDKDWIRDGIPKTAPAGRGKRAVWTEAVMSAVRPSHWQALFRASPEELIAAATDDDFGDALLAGWTEAAIRFAGDSASAAWLVPLWDWWSQRARKARDGRSDAPFWRLVNCLPQSEAERCVLPLLKHAMADAAGPGLELLAQLPRPWSGDFSRQFLQMARYVLKKYDDNRAYQWVGALLTAARSIPRECFAEALEQWDTRPVGGHSSSYGQSAQRQTEQFQEIVRFRASFFAEAHSNK